MSTLSLGTRDTPASLVAALRRHGAACAGPEADTVRAAIKSGGLSAVILGRGSTGKPESYRQAFERIYGESL